VYHGSSAAYRASVDGTLLPAVMDRIFVDNRNFHTPPALLPSLEKGAMVLHTVLTVHPRTAGLYLADALVLIIIMTTQLRCDEKSS